jgi:2-methylisocitrate lyase-like PEP mutase family enzyme
MISQRDKALAFMALHESTDAFIIPNPWDAGSARILAQYGFKALATTSAGHAFSMGRPDGGTSRDEALRNAAAIVAATDLPVSGDLENGFGDAPTDCAETVRLAVACGLIGCSIEDYSGRDEAPIYPLDLAVDRIRAAVAAARALPFPFLVTARSENYLHGNPNIGDTLLRLKAFAEAGADVLFAPGLRTSDEIVAAVKAVAPKPLNVIMGLTGSQFSRQQLAELGVRRISVGGSLARAAYGAFMRAAEEMATTGTFAYAADAVPHARINAMLRG